MNLASRDYQEKRSYIRMKVDTPVDIQLEQGGNLHGICHNLSGGGMLISLSEPLPIGTTMEATLSSNHGHNPMLKAMVRVKRIQAKPNASSQPCKLALEILDVVD